MESFTPVQNRQRRGAQRRWSLVLAALAAVMVLSGGAYPYLNGSEASESASPDDPVGRDLLVGDQGNAGSNTDSPEHESPLNYMTTATLNQTVPRQLNVHHTFNQTRRLDYVKHRVRRGESLWSIAQRYGRETFTVVSANFDRLKHRDYLPEGIELRIPNRDGVLTELNPGQTLWDLSRSYRVEAETILAFNGVEDAGSLRAGEKLFVPGAHPVNPYRYRLFEQGSHPLGWPVGPARRNVSSKFGMRHHPVHKRRMRHTGIDIAARRGVAVLAAEAGRVHHAGRIRGYGKVIVLKHPNGLKTVYAHLSQAMVRRGQYVQQGQRIGQTGSSGLTTGVNLHFEVRENGAAKDPLEYIP